MRVRDDFRPILSLHDLSSFECALIGATATTKAIIASKGGSLRALADDELAVSIETIRAFADADLNVAGAAERIHVHPNTIRYRLQQIATKTGHDPRTFAGLVELLCILDSLGDGVDQLFGGLPRGGEERGRVAALPLA